MTSFPNFCGKCIKCHGGAEPMAGLDLRTLTTIVAGSKKGSVVAPGQPNESKILQMVEKGIMPPGDRLPTDQVALIRDWIAKGQFPPKDEALRKAKAGGITEEAGNSVRFGHR